MFQKSPLCFAVNNPFLNSKTMPAKTICSFCHESGHHVSTCRELPAGGAPKDKSPPPPCRWCDGDHYSNTCALKSKRQKNRLCIRCGPANHWVKACPEFTKIKEDPIGVGANTLWCMQCNSTDHATMPAFVVGLLYTSLMI